jgi:hypothetical protein
MKTRFFYHPLACLLVFGAASVSASAATGCSGTSLGQLGGVKNAWKLSDGGIAAFSRLNINIDGYGRAYHLKNEAGSLIHLCNAGRVYKPDGSFYEGSESNTTCTGRFMTDVVAIQAAGWKDPAVGAVNWYGVLGTGSATVKGKKIMNVVPVLQKDGSGFAVSPTTLADSSIGDEADQSRYVNPLHIPAAVVPRALIQQGVAMGSFGVAYNTKMKKIVPFVVGDAGPRIGEGSLALARLASGLPLKDDIKKSERFAGQIDTPDVLWIFFKDEPARFDSRNAEATVEKTRVAFEAWGGEARLQACLAVVPHN